MTVAKPNSGVSIKDRAEALEKDGAELGAMGWRLVTKEAGDPVRTLGDASLLAALKAARMHDEPLANAASPFVSIAQFDGKGAAKAWPVFEFGLTRV